jgi:hypothetical protein
VGQPVSSVRNTIPNVERMKIDVFIITPLNGKTPIRKLLQEDEEHQKDRVFS